MGRINWLQSQHWAHLIEMDVFAFHNGQLIHCNYTGSTPQPVDFAVRAITVEAAEG